MQQSSGKTYENWPVKSLRNCLLESMGDLYCFVWDLKQRDSDKPSIMRSINKTSKKCGSLLTALEKKL